MGKLRFDGINPSSAGDDPWKHVGARLDTFIFVHQDTSCFFLCWLARFGRLLPQDKPKKNIYVTIRMDVDHSPRAM